MNLSEQAEGRSIRATLLIQMTPQNGGECGDTDAAMEIGHGLLNESMALLKRSAEAEGFTFSVKGEVRVI